MATLRITLRRKSEPAVDRQDQARDGAPRSYRHPEVRSYVAARRVWRRRYGA